MKLSLNLKLSQTLKLTPLLQQSIKILQASQVELDNLIEEYLAKNIFLEAEDNLKLRRTSKNFNEIYHDYKSIDKQYDIFENQVKNQTLKEYLIENIAIFSFSDRDQIIFSFLIDAIDDNGYLSENLKEIQNIIPVSPLVEDVEIERLLKLIQNTSLPGIGARNLSECLILQLDIIECNSKILSYAKSIILYHLDLLGNKNYKKLKSKLSCSDNELEKSIKLIKQLNPKPGLLFQKIDKTDYITIDVIIEKLNNKWKVTLNNDNHLNLRINDDRDDYLSNDPNKSLKEQYQEAKWLIKNLHQRSISILRVSRAIMEKQKSFLEKGELFIKPLILKDIANELELHESTISRITSNKFISTPYGIFELKHFFGSTIKTNDGDLSSKAVLLRIKKIIDNELPNKPYSDEKLCLLLNEQGVKIARRTIAKYREVLKILPSNQRKRI